MPGDKFDVEEISMESKGMGRVFAAVVAGLFCLIASTGAWAVDEVKFSNLSLADRDTGTVGLYFTNDVDVKSVVFPIIIRSVNGGAFWEAGSYWQFNPNARLNGFLNEIVVKTRVKTDNVPCPTNSPNQQGFQNTTDTTWDYISADGILAAKQKIFQASLPAGTDGEIGVGTPSILFFVNATSAAGQFEFDTTCVVPANKLQFVNTSNVVIKPAFTKGTVTVGTAVHDISTGSAVPERYELMQNHPNPFNAGTVIQFTNRRDGNVKLDVFNILGQHVRTLMDEYRGYGTYAVDWDGKDESGRSVSSGMYFYRLAAGDFTDVKKMVLIK